MAQDVDMTLFKRTVSILYVGLQSKDIDFQSICSCLFYLSGKLNPVCILIAVNAGNDRNVTDFLGFFNQIQIFAQFMFANVSYQVIASFRIHVGISKPIGFHHDLFLKKRLEYNGSCSGFVKLLVLGGTVGKSGTADNNRVFKF